jgi:hypothetical protein
MGRGPTWPIRPHVLGAVRGIPNERFDLIDFVVLDLSYFLSSA